MANLNTKGVAGGFPRGTKPSYEMQVETPITLTPADHKYGAFKDEMKYTTHESDFLVPKTKEHMTRDVTDPNLANMPVTYRNFDGTEVPVFSGATTNVNPFDNIEMKNIIEHGLGNVEEENVKYKYGDNAVPRVSPMLPFTRLDPYYAQQSNLIAYNRTKTPVADLEFRKGFRHIFITRPECYIMASENGSPILSQQAENDEDFASAASRMPHILSLLSPSYVTGSFSSDKSEHNWNFLLSNRVTGMSAAPSMSVSFDENMTKSAEGYTISPAKYMTSRQGSTLSLTFTDTKNLEVNELFHLWMAYMHKRKKGIFSPPYNGYKYKNGFLQSSKVSGRPIYHPYDRALEYCCTIFDIVTNESGTKILYWCKYYGCYPTEETLDGLTNDNNGPIASSPKVNVTFKYHRKLENVNKTLIEFNYNSGLTDNVGKAKTLELFAAHPFLLRETANQQYIGASSMFTGTPYIIMCNSGKDPHDGKVNTVSPYLQFMPMNVNKLSWNVNNGIINTSTTSDAPSLVGVKDPSKKG